MIPKLSNLKEYLGTGPDYFSIGESVASWRKQKTILPGEGGDSELQGERILHNCIGERYVRLIVIHKS